MSALGLIIFRCPDRAAISPEHKNVIYEGTPHGKAELAFFFFLLVLNLIYLAVDYVELYKLEFCVVTALQMCGANGWLMRALPEALADSRKLDKQSVLLKKEVRSLT